MAERLRLNLNVVGLNSATGELVGKREEEEDFNNANAHLCS